MASGDLGACSSEAKDELERCISRIYGQISAKKWRPLGTQLGFSDVELDNLKYNMKFETIEETIRQMLLRWKQRYGTDATVQKLATALRQVELTDLADQILPSMPCGSENPRMTIQDATRTLTGLNAEELDYVTELSRQLQAEYRHFILPRLSWRDSTLLLEELCVDLSIIEQDQHKRGERAERIELQQLFLPSPTHLSNRFLLVSEPGFEATLALKKLAFDWGKRQEYMTGFELVIFIDLGHIRNSFQELIEEAAAIISLPIPVLELLAKMGNKVLVLLDGYDEHRHGQIKDLDRVLRSEMLPDTTVIVSSRTQTIKQTYFWSRLIEIESITGSRGKDILSKYLTTAETG